MLISSAAVFGSRRGLVTEDTPPDPDSFPVPEYAWAKLAAEHATLRRALDAEWRCDFSALYCVRPRGGAAR